MSQRRHWEVRDATEPLSQGDTLHFVASENGSELKAFCYQFPSLWHAYERASMEASLFGIITHKTKFSVINSFC